MIHKHRSLTIFFYIGICFVLISSTMVGSDLASAQEPTPTSESSTPELQCFTLELVVAEGEGTLEAKTPQNCGVGYLEGTVVELLASPADGFFVYEWQGTNDELNLSPVNNVTISSNQITSVSFTEEVVAEFPFTQTQDDVSAQSTKTIYVSTIAKSTGRVYQSGQCGTDDGNIIVDGSFASVGESNGWVRFDTSSIPDGSTINAITLYVKPYFVDVNGVKTDFNDLEHDPTSGTCAQIWSDIHSGITFKQDYVFAGGDTTWKSIALNSFAAFDLQNRLAQNWFAVGIDFDDSDSNRSVDLLGYLDTNRPYIVVDYTAPPAPSPNPDIEYIYLNGDSSVSNIEIFEGDTLNLRVRAKNNGGNSPGGTIGVSFPDFRSYSNKDLVSLNASTSSDLDGSAYKEYPPNSTNPSEFIYYMDGSTPNPRAAVELLVDATDDSGWDAGETNNLYLDINFPGVGDYEILVKIAMPDNNGNFYFDPDAAWLDQQGELNFRRTVRVNERPTYPDIDVQPSSLSFTREDTVATALENNITVSSIEISETTRDNNHQALYERLKTQDRIHVIVYLQNPQNTFSSIDQLAISTADLQASVLGRLTKDEFTLNNKFILTSSFIGEITRQGLDKLLSMQEVSMVYEDIPISGSLEQSIPLINADDVHTLGFTGDGVTVAVLDSGVDVDHPDLSDDLLAEHCFTQGACPPSNTNESTHADDGHGHGTSVSGIISSNGTVAPQGVAPDASIVAVKIFADNNTGNLNDIALGIDWVTAHQAEFDISVINISGGGGLYTNNCDTAWPALAQAVSNAIANDIVIFAASGNNGSSTSMMAPACINGVISVGAVYDANVGSYNGTCTDPTTSADQVTCFSNSNNLLDIMAPSWRNNTSALNGGETFSFGGTSAASPHAAAVAALMLEANPGLDPATIETHLEDSGIDVPDPKNNLTFPRIDALAAVQLGGSITIFNTGTAPLIVDNIRIENGACWLPVPEPHNFSIPIGGSQVVLVNVNHSCVGVGTHNSAFLIDSNDPDSNENPFRVPVTLEVLPSPVVGPLEYNSHVIHDGSGGGTGNSNGIVECGESIDLDVILKNLGNDDATSVNAILSTSDSYISITDDDENYPNIAGGGGTGTSVGDYDFDVAPNTPNNRIITFNLNITSSNGGSWSDTFNIPVTCSSISPAAFNKTSPADSAPNQSITPTLSWGSTSPLTRYEYCYDSTINDTCNGTWTENGTATSVILPTLSYSTPYEWHVRAYNGTAGPTYSNASASAFWTFTTTTAPTNPPNAFNKTSPADSAPNQSITPTLSWGSTSPLTRYEYCYDSTINDTCNGTWTENGTATSVILPTLSYSTPYEWHVRAYNGTAGPTYSNATASAFWTFTTVTAPTNPPNTFNKSSPANSTTPLQPLNVSLTWGSTTPLTLFQYCIDATNDNACSNWVDNGTSTSVVPPNLQYSTTYYWHVRAYNGSAGPTYSNASTTAFWTFKTQDAPPTNSCNTNPISIPANQPTETSGIASLYPSSINLSGYGTYTTDVNVRLLGLSHTWPSDIDILVVGPQGQNLIIMSDTGSSDDVSNINLTLDDSAIQQLPATLLTQGTYKPTNSGTGDPFSSPAPTPSSATALSIFNGSNPNGTWSLYIYDDASGDTGSLSGGWCLDVQAVNGSTQPFRSAGANDGWILETTETSTTGGTMNSTATTLWLGDDASDRQYRAILHFDTSSLPDTAVVTSATLQLRKQSTSGTNPFTILGSLRVDARKPDFGLPTLELADFRTSGAKNNIATFNPTPVSNWYSAVFNSAGRLYINRTGTTQFKIYFTTGDNDDLGADLIKFYSGNAGASSRPKLVIQYYVP